MAIKIKTTQIGGEGIKASKQSVKHQSGVLARILASRIIIKNQDSGPKWKAFVSALD